MLSFGELTELTLKVYSQVFPSLYEVNGHEEAEADLGKIFYNLADDNLIILVEKAVREYAESKGIEI